MSLLPILYWIVLILSTIGYFGPRSAPAPAPIWGYRLAGGAYIVLFILIGLRIFRTPL